jgi:ribosomal protein S1
MNFNEINIGELDKDLSPQERKEWNAVYASYRAGSIMSGNVTGVDAYSIGDEKMLTVVVIPYRVKILIPETQMWEERDKIPSSITRNLLGAKIDFVITEIDRENSVCVASRIAASHIKKKQFFNGKPMPKAGDVVKCSILAVGAKRVLAEVCGVDLRLNRQELCYSAVNDFRSCFMTGQSLPALIKSVNKNTGKLSVSVRDAKPHPYIGLRNRHPLNCRRSSVITGKYKGAIFCKLEDDYDCLCTYTEFQRDSDFEIGDNVVIVIKKYSDAAQRVFGVIISKWN